MTDSDQPRDDDLKLLEILEQAVDLDADEIDGLLAGYPDAVAARARQLLVEGATEGFLAAPVGQGETPTETGPFPSTTRVGPYELLGLLGEGGMGRVYLAEQHEPVRRRVALKLLRLSLLDRSEAVRFEAERQAMGRLDHVNVGKILEAGTTWDGMPFIAMEWIDGPPITTYCDTNALSLEQRLRLFIDTCRGVDHAHRKLLLHRDIKPSNILVAEFDGRAIPKLIDFGIAKGLDTLGDSELTRDRVVGTPTYMSPEALSKSHDVDVRSDVFALGVVLYELLTGVQPWTEAGSLTSRFDRGTSDPDRPSTRVSRLDVERREPIAEARRESAKSLAKGLRGDLDWIVMKAIAHDPGERYASAADLAEDIERFLRSEPVTARRATASYLVQQLVRRHRRAVGVALSVLLTLILGIVGTTLGFVRARQAEQAAKIEAAAAVQARDEAERVVEFLSEVFNASGVENSAVAKPPTELTALELLDRSAERIDSDLDIQPLTKARLETTLGEIYRQLGVFDEARGHFEAARELLGRADAAAVDQAETLRELIELNLRDGRLDETRDQLDDLAEWIPRIPDGPRRALAEARWLAAEASWHSMSGDFDRSIEWMQRAIGRYETIPKLHPQELATSMSNLGNIYFRQHRWRDAETQYRQALASFEKLLDPGHARIAVVSDNLGAAVASQNRYAEAIPFFERALSIRRRMLEPSHPRIADSLNNIGRLHHDSERYVQAEATHREALAIRRAALEPTHPKIAWSLDNLAVAVAAQGRVDEAVALQTEALEIRRRRLGPEHLDVARSWAHLSRLESDPAAAERLLRRAITIRRAAFGAEHTLVGEDLTELAEWVWRQGRRDEARKTFERGRSILVADGESSADTLAEVEAKWRALVDGSAGSGEP